MTAARQRWDHCKLIAEILGINKVRVHNKLYTKIVEAEKLNAILEGNAEAIDWVKALPEFNPRLRVHQPVNQQKDDIAEGPEDQIRVAMWFIRKIGSPEQAKIAVDIASQALHKLSRKMENASGE